MSASDPMLARGADLKFPEAKPAILSVKSSEEPETWTVELPETFFRQIEQQAAKAKQSPADYIHEAVFLRMVEALKNERKAQTIRNRKRKL